MFAFKCNIILSIVLNYLELIQSLVEMPPPIEENVILKSEAIIRYTINSLFYNLKFKKMKEHAKFKEYSTIHKYFTSLALQDFDTLNKIARAVRVNNKSINKTSDFMEIINNAFALHQFVENNKNKETDNDDSVITYILYFLRNLKKFKETHSVDKTYLNINTNILKLFIENSNKFNDSSILYKSDDSNNIKNENGFWEPSGRRIYKGDRTKIKHFPFMASIQIFNNFYCAGSIIKSDLIVTASSCLQLAWNNRLFRENPAFLSARVGSSFYTGGGEVIPVLEIYFHPDYNPKNLKNNICVLRLIRHLNFRKRNHRIRKIAFDRQPSSIPVTTPGITILGWGAKEHSPVIGNPWKNVLSSAVLDVYPLEECQDVYSREYVTRKNFCAGFISRGGGACNRDVGGPGIADSKLMGVISFGSPVCGTPDAPTVFTKLGYYSDWIEEIMEMDVPVSKKSTTLKSSNQDPFRAPIYYTSPKPTTFKIPPLTGENNIPKPISFTDNDNQLRIFDENVFKDFLATMFQSEEITENNHAKDVDDSIGPESTVNYEEKTETSKPFTEYEDVSSEESGTRQKDTAVTLNEEENQAIDYDLNGEIEKWIENVDLEKIVKEEVKVTPMVVKDINEVGDIKTSDSLKSKNESVLTLLYLSDDEKNGKVKVIPSDEKEEYSNGMSIPVDSFKDLTRAKDKEASGLSESELFGLLSEVIEQ